MAPSKIYILNDSDGTAESTRCLFENQNIQASILKPGDQNDPSLRLSGNDVILIHLDVEQDHIFKILNEFMYRADCPHIILTTNFDGPLQISDCFPGDRISVLMQPFKPEALFDAVRLH